MSGFFATAGAPKGVLSRRFRLFAVGVIVGAALVVLAVAFLAFAAYLALLDHIAPWQAALAVAGAAFAVGAVLIVVAVNSLGKAVDQVKAAVKTNAVAKAAPLAAGFAVRNPRLVARLAGLAAAVAAVVASVRALREKAKAEG